ncbi:hypothetical protein HAZT_HAZT009892, partial [Hyalella azteca]
ACSSFEIPVRSENFSPKGFRIFRFPWEHLRKQESLGGTGPSWNGLLTNSQEAKEKNEKSGRS